MRKFVFVLVIFIIYGCGYKPSSYYAKNSIKGLVYVNLKIDIKNTNNSVFIKDAMNDMIIHKFHSSLTSDKDKADSLVFVELSKVSHSTLVSDDEGYAKNYRTTVTIKVTYNLKNKPSTTLTLSNYYDYSVENSSVLTDEKKQEAVKIAASKALQDMFSKIAIKSLGGKS